MKRPLMAVCLCLVAVAAIRLFLWEKPPDTVLIAEGSQFTATGKVYQRETRTIYGGQIISIIYLDSVRIQDDSVPFHLLCELKQGGELPIGCQVTVQGEWKPFLRAGNPGEFDAALYYRSRNIPGNMKNAVLLAKGEAYSLIGEWLARLRGYWKERLYHCLPEKEASIMTTMLLGDKSSLDKGIKELYKRNGIIHILSISGLHITIIGMGIFRLLRKAGLPVWTAALLGAVLLVLYGMMTGMGVSSCRAIGMYLLRMLGETVGKTYDMMTALGVMGAIMVLYRPEYLYNSGFLLSFGSVCGIGMLLPVLEGKGKTAGLLAPGTAISLFTLPIHFCFFYEVPVYSVLVNLLVLPLMSIVMGVGLVTMVLPGIGVATGWALRLILGAYEWLCRLSDCLPYHTWTAGCPEPWQVAAYYLLLSGFVFWRGRAGNMQTRNGKKAAIRAFEGVWILGAVWVLAIRLPQGTSVTFLDVGQGDCIFVQTEAGENYLFDCGSSTKQKIGQYTLIPFLKYRGVTKLDGVFVSHPDSDHCNGILELLEIGEEQGIRVKNLILPAIAEERREAEWGELLEAAQNASPEAPVRVSYMGAGAAWKSGDTCFTCVHPAEGSTLKDANGYSQCFFIEQGDFSLLLTGDVEGEGEAQLYQALERRGIADVTVLKTAHHGSASSTSPELLSLINPNLAVISYGKDNSYGHPHREVVERLREAGAEIYTTAKMGAITLYVEDKVSVLWHRQGAGNGIR